MDQSASFAQEAPTEFVVAPTEIGSFQLDGAKRLWKSIYNKEDNIKEWQFKYDCLFLPESSSGGKLAASVVQLPKGFRIAVPIRLNSKNAQELALAKVIELYGKPISIGQISPLMIGSLEISIPNLSEQIPSAVLVTKSLGFSKPTDSFNIFIDVASKDDAKQVVNFLNSGGAQIDYKMSFAAKKQALTYVEVTYSDLRNSKLFVELKGLNPGAQTAYVQRNDMRKLMEDINKTITVDGVIENPAEFDANIYTAVLANLTHGVSSQQFDETKWKSTYHGDDLRPDKVTSELNKLFSKDQGSDQWKRDTTVKVGASASFLGFGGSANVDTNFSSEGLKSWLKENGVDSETTGEKIIVKSIDLQQMNLSDFNVQGKFKSQLAYVDVLRDPKGGNIQLVANHQAIPGIAERVNTVENSMAPVGTIIASASPNNKPTDDWLICDGKELARESYSELYKAIGDYWGKAKDGFFKLPDLRGLFLRGLDSATGTIDKDLNGRTPLGCGKASNIGSYQGDSTKMPNTPFVTDKESKHRHKDPTYNGTSGPFELAGSSGGIPNWNADYGDQAAWTEGGEPHEHTITRGGDSETRPKNVSVNWLIRAR